MTPPARGPGPGPAALRPEFKSVEHVIPEGLGNDHVILPRGIVCDDCNHGKLSGLDREFLPIALMRITHGLRTKAGKLPSARFGNAHVHMLDEGSIVIEQHGGRAVHPTEEGLRLTLGA